MDVVPIELFGVSIDLPLPKPVSMRSTVLEDFARDLCDPLKGIGVRAAQCQLVGRDLLYQYELNATFFEERHSCAYPGAVAGGGAQCSQLGGLAVGASDVLSGARLG